MSDSTWRLIGRSNPALRQKVGGLNPSDREEFVVRLIGKFTSSAIGDSSLRDAIVSISARNHIGVDPAMAQELLSISERLDDEYFTLNEQGKPQEIWGKRFQEARLAFALHISFSDGGLQDLSEVIYELAHADGSPDSFLVWAGSLINSGGTGKRGRSAP